MEYSPTVRGRRLIREIERLRHGSGLSMEAAAQRLGWSTSKLYRLENGRSRITTDDLEDMLDLYGVRSPQREALIQVGRDARRRGWWTAYSDVFTRPSAPTTPNAGWRPAPPGRTHCSAGNTRCRST